MKAIAIIQARMGSTRLKGKSLMKISEYTLLETVVHSVKRNKFINDVVIATTNLEQDDAIENLCIQKKIKCYRGDSEDVLSRFIEIAKKYDDNDTIVRVTADNPINNHIVSEQIYKIHIENNNDYTFIKSLSHTVYEFIKVKSLLSLQNVEKLESEDKEHVTIYFRKESEKFKVQALNPEKYNINSKKDKLLTIDSQEDYSRFMNIKNFIDLDKSIDFNKLYKFLSN
ncbi:hypothetical protein [Polaribacter sp. Hel_I_88]|uniref:cytidylyltransferase domain-containing protein n=1 Tax=Polaribacter sp. Hel_I_88 TaxID=1250006 RepID=UPI00068E6804|nr:hypothetical protein [Polaribacter sp. Hel_I_88]